MRGSRQHTMSLTVCEIFLQYLCIIMLPVVVNGGFERTCRRGDESQRRGICGMELSNVLDLMCAGRFNAYGKRSSDHTLPMIPRNVHGDLKDDFKDKVVSRQSALNFLAHKRSAVYYQSITCECCQYQCGLAEMRSYCSDDDDMWSMFKKRSDRIASSTNTASAEKELNDLG